MSTKILDLFVFGLLGSDGSSLSEACSAFDWYSCPQVIQVIITTIVIRHDRAGLMTLDENEVRDIRSRLPHSSIRRKASGLKKRVS
jgi:hypothetical protein